MANMTGVQPATVRPADAQPVRSAAVAQDHPGHPRDRDRPVRRHRIVPDAPERHLRRLHLEELHHPRRRAGRHLRPDRAGVHAGLRHAADDQLRARRGVHVRRLRVVLLRHGVRLERVPEQQPGHRARHHLSSWRCWSRVRSRCCWSAWPTGRSATRRAWCRSSPRSARRCSCRTRRRALRAAGRAYPVPDILGGDRRGRSSASRCSGSRSS